MTRDGKERLGSGEQKAGKTAGLALYGYPQCPYCDRVLRAAAALGLDLELRNTLSDSECQRDLIEAMGRRTVPVLRIEHEDGSVDWMPESSDIVDYLEERFSRS